MTGRILAELKQTRPFASLGAEALVNLLRTADTAQRSLAAVLKPHSLSPEQYNVLRILRGAGTDGLPCGEIAARMITRDPDMTRLLDRLEARGLIGRARDTKDRRVVNTRIQPAGLRLLGRLDGPLAAENERLVGHLGPKRLRMLVALLEAVREERS
ncbi:MAG TPA: MarR family transcriptional regulator [Candidatus Acidoferrales bacterium]|nr:MarR family transcriptional regulator [Candidatus Acidoferrales bacterium]